MSMFNNNENPNNSGNNIPSYNQYPESLIKPGEMSLFFEDILKNKEMIKQMLTTNITIYQDKTKSNAEKIKEIKDEINKIDSDFMIVENKLKLEFAKAHDNVQKHEINFKLLDKTYSHYKSLILEREGEIRKLEEKLLFAEQDYQNKKIKLDCLNIQITEAEFQLKNLNSKLNDKVENLIEEGESDSIIEFKKKFEVQEDKQNSKIQQNFVEPVNKEKFLNVDEYLKEKIKYSSSYSKKSFGQEDNFNNSEIFDSISNKTGKNFNHKNNCLIF